MRPHKAAIGSRTALAVTGCTIALGACGGQTSKPTTPTGRSPVALSRCMRAHGLSGFPDPAAGPNRPVGLSLMVESDDSLTAGGISFAGPAVRTAEKACKAYLPPAGGPPAKVRAEQLHQDLVLARCMRAHGVPNFPDPSTSGGQGGLPAHLDPQSPAFRAAGRECRASASGNFDIGD